MKSKKPRVSARGAVWTDGDAAVEKERTAKELRGPAATLVFVGGGVEALERYANASDAERAEFDATTGVAYALGGHVAVVELVKGRSS